MIAVNRWLSHLLEIQAFFSYPKLTIVYPLEGELSIPHSGNFRLLENKDSRIIVTGSINCNESVLNAS